ncbi:DNA polymerase IV [Vallitalea longa]|uniref:DNA polymerase IV n=2 Tax=Vallitalea longa TaxID=2936439 RepID=A0A9W5YEH8_9FIRM|nr:DNA polymerase IV [Vallitalea longa]
MIILEHIFGILPINRVITMRTIFHIDMNSFFASCEQALNPKLKEKPLIVGGDPKKRRGIVLAASYDAKAYGVKTTMPIWQAVKLCPEAVIIRPTHNLYSNISKKIMNIFDEYTPLKQQLSIDEAFLDMTGTENLFGSTLEAASIIQNRLLDELDIPCSVGISSNKLLAKMASDYKKPLGITEIYPKDIENKLWHLPVGELYGVGKKTTIALNKINVKTIGDLAKCPVDTLATIIGNKYANEIHDSANGIGESIIDPNVRNETKSISNEITFSSDIDDLDKLKKEALLLADSVSWRLRKHMLKGKTISIKIKYSNFKTITRSITINNPTDVTDIIYNKTCNLLDNLELGQSVRLLGVGIGNFDNSEYQQLSLFEKEENVPHKKEQVDRLVDELRERFGYDSVKRASLIDNSYNPKQK